MNKFDFTAIDFETATGDMMACQVGIVTVRNGIFVEKRSILIQPPNNEYTASTIKIHGITPEMTERCPTFEKVWKDIGIYFSDDLIVAHNASFDESVLYKNLSHYGIMPNKIGDFKCTYSIYGKSLDESCADLGISCSGHHDALFDAECCAKLYMTYLTKGKYLNYDKQFGNYDKNTGYHTSIPSDLLIQDLSNADPDNPFYDKKVVISGTFDCLDRISLAEILKDMGADINTCISRKTNIVLIGHNAGPKKLEKINELRDSGVDIKIICESDLLELMSSYLKEEE